MRGRDLHKESEFRSLEGGINRLADMPTPAMIGAQIARFTIESVRASTTRSFDPRLVLAAFSASGGSEVMAVDIGGDKLIASRYVVRQGSLRQERPQLTRDGGGGYDYIEALEDVVGLARASDMPVGVSYAGPVQGSRVLAGVNVPVFLSELQSRYGGDFGQIDDRITLVNDAEAGLLAASLEAFRRYPQARNIIYVINGSGIGCAVLRRNEIITTEAGHVEADRALNDLSQRSQCGMLGASFVCLERIGASKAGIEDIWARRRGYPLSGLADR